MQKKIFICGPTGSGKSELALNLAKKLESEIINIDSVQIYKELDIGSAKPSREELVKIKHHLIDKYSPDNHCDVYKYISDLELILKDFATRNLTPIITGGSTLYIKAYLEGLIKNADKNIEVRNNLELKNNDTLYEMLLELDPKSAKRIGLNDKFRLIRAIELLKSTNAKSLDDLYSEQKKEKIEKNALIILLCLDRKDLYKRINLRAKKMLENGLVSETKKLIKDYDQSLAIFKTLGYKQVIDFLNNNLEESELLEEISKFTRRYAKRQMTFWRNEPKKNNWKQFIPDFNTKIEELEGFKAHNLSLDDISKSINSYLKGEYLGVSVLYIRR